MGICIVNHWENNDIIKHIPVDNKNKCLNIDLGDLTVCFIGDLTVFVAIRLHVLI